MLGEGGGGFVVGLKSREKFMKHMEYLFCRSETTLYLVQWEIPSEKLFLGMEFEFL